MKRANRVASLHIESLETRCVLAAIYPAYVDGVFTFGDAAETAPYGLENTFKLESLPSADKVIYLDFDGHHSVNNSWNHNIVFPAFSLNGDATTFANNELIEIQKQFQNVAEDFAPFNINVTTMDPGIDALRKVGAGDTEYGVRMVATQPTNGFGSGIGGVALLNSFNDFNDNPVFAFNKGARNGGMTASHEVGHALGLSHDGLNSQSYHPGVGSGQTGWGPLMGAPFGKPLTHWSKGEYAGATTLQDDLAIITKPANGFGYKVDDHGSILGSATELVADNGEIFEWGVIERNTDLDFFMFSTEAGEVSISIKPFAQDANVDVEAKLYDSSGTELVTENPLTLVGATIVEDLAAGTYFLSVDGVGRPDRYTEYGSLGFYTIDATIVDTAVVDGDFNDDGEWDLIDVDNLVADIAGTGTPATYDLTGDGLVDLADRDAWLAEAGGINLVSGNSYLLGDANLDGNTDAVDLSIWNTNKFTSAAAWSAADFNADGFVDGFDFFIWNANKGLSALTPLDTTLANSLDLAGDEAPFWPLTNDLHYHDHDELDSVDVVFAQDALASSSEPLAQRTKLTANSDVNAVVDRASAEVQPQRAGYARQGFRTQATSQQTAAKQTHADRLSPTMVNDKLA